MFDNISARYDLLNRLLSMRMDVVWRKKVMKILSNYAANNILDVATGTGDLAIELIKLKPEQIIGIDISPKMLEKGRKKIIKAKLANTIELVEMDAAKIMFSNDMFDIVTCAFGVRNFNFLEKSLKEMNRVLKPDGILAILEFSKTSNRFLNLYMNKFLPYIGKNISKNKTAYTYLIESIKDFPSDKNFIKILKSCYFEIISIQKMNLGTVTLYLASKI